MKAYTDIIQSKKLAEILPIESADFSWTNFSSKGLNYTDEWQAINKTPKEVEETVLSAFYTMGDKWKIIPCWSLAALMNLLPSEFTTENKLGKYNYEIKIRKYNLIEDVNLYQIAYGNYKFHEDGSSSWKDMINTGEKEDLLDAAFEMVCLLKENGKI